MKFLQENDISSEKIAIMDIKNTHNDYFRRNNGNKTIDKIKLLVNFLIIILFFIIIYNKLDENRKYIENIVLKFSNYSEHNYNKYNSSKKNAINFNSNIFPFFEQNNKIKPFFFFNEHQDDLDYCKNYGLFIYNYYYNGVINEPNIGDYIQSLAALQYLPKNCKPYFVDRDLIQFYYGPKIKLIMNSWNIIHEGSKYISENIEPIYISYNLFSQNNIPSNYIENMKKYQPIGCRDLRTKHNFRKNNIDSYFSSCLTTTLDIDYAAPEQERTEEIIFIDYEFGDYPEADEYLLSLKSYNFSRVIHTYHKFDLSLSHIQRFQLAKKLLDRYARAKLVISSRLHGALPCLALKTPVILIKKRYDYYRFEGLYELLNTIGNNYNKKFEINVNLDEKGFVYNSKEYLKYAEKLKDKLKEI